jgi:predicted O-methyltransferase YrrM
MRLNNSLFRVFQYLKYLSKAVNAHSLHSPFVYDLYTKVIKDSTPFYVFDKIESIRAKALLSRQKILVEDFGTGASNGGNRQLTVPYIARQFVKPKKYGQLLFRLVNYFGSENILEIGTSLGITTLYLALSDKNKNVISLEGSGETSKIARHNFQLMNVSNIELLEGEFSTTLPVAINKMQQLDLVYFDGNHKKTPTIDYFIQCLSKHHENSVFIFDDIYWSRGMADAWQEIKKNDSVTLSIDLYSIGIIFFKTGVKKQHFILRY